MRPGPPCFPSCCVCRAPCLVGACGTNEDGSFPGVTSQSCEYRRLSACYRVRVHSSRLRIPHSCSSRLIDRRLNSGTCHVPATRADTKAKGAKNVNNQGGGPTGRQTLPPARSKCFLKLQIKTYGTVVLKSNNTSNFTMHSRDVSALPITGLGTAWRSCWPLIPTNKEGGYRLASTKLPPGYRLATIDNQAVAAPHYL